MSKIINLIFFKKLYFVFTLFILLCLITLFSCSMFQKTEGCPYGFISAQIVKATDESEFSVGALEIVVSNLSKKEISSINLSCRLYRKADGKNPFVGDNKVCGNSVAKIKSGEKKTFFLPLDSFTSTITLDQMAFDFLYANEVKFSDGSSWCDFFGTYAFNSIRGLK